jgi:integrase
MCDLKLCSFRAFSFRKTYGYVLLSSLAIITVADILMEHLGHKDEVTTKNVYFYMYVQKR